VISLGGQKRNGTHSVIVKTTTRQFDGILKIPLAFISLILAIAKRQFSFGYK
jgi:hypothetical protein